MLTNHLISGPIRGEYYLCGQELHLPEADLLVQQVAGQLHPWSQIAEVLPVAWNNGKEVPRWGVAEIQKMSPLNIWEMLLLSLTLLLLVT